MSSNYIQEAGLAIKAYSLLCQVTGTLSEVIIMGLQNLSKSNPSPKERQCIAELMKEAKKIQEIPGYDSDELNRKMSDTGMRQTKYNDFQTKTAGGAACFSVMPSFVMANELHKNMDRANIPSVCMRFDISGYDTDNFPKELRDQISAYDLTKSEVSLVVVPKGWAREAQEVIEQYRIQHLAPGEQSYQDLIKYANYNVRSIEGLSEEQTMVMKQRLNEAHVMYAVEGPSDGTYRINFAAFDTKKFKAVSQCVDHEMHQGQYTTLLKENICWIQENDRKNLYEVKNGTRITGETVEHGSAYVGRNGSTIEMQKDRILFTSAEGTEKVYRRTKTENFNKVVNDLMINKMIQPVAMTAQEYTHYKEIKAMGRSTDDFLVDIERKNGRPSFSKEDIAIIAKESARNQIIAEKLSQATHGTDRDAQNPYIDTQSFWNFKAEETRNFEEAFDMYEKDQSDGIYQGDDVQNENGKPQDPSMEDTYISDIEIQDVEISPSEMDADIDIVSHIGDRGYQQNGLDEEAIDMVLNGGEA